MNSNIRNAIIISVATSITFAFVGFAISMRRRKQTASELLTDIFDVAKNIVLSKSQESYIQTLHVKAQPIFRAFVADLERNGWRVIFTSAGRDSTKQAKLHNDNPSNAQAGYSMHEYGMACYSDDTELLTENGWKLFKDLPANDRILVFKNGEMYYEHPIATIKKQYDGEMVSVKTKSVDLLVTPNHKMIVKKKGYLGWDKNWNSIDASDLTYRYKIPTVGTYINNAPKNDVPNSFCDSKTWWEFMGWYLSEGFCCGVSDGKIRTHNGRWVVAICQYANSKDWHSIKDCLDRMGVHYRYMDGRQFIIHSKELHSILFKLGNTYQKRIPRYLLKADNEHLSILLESLILGDGTHYKKRISYWTANKGLANDVSELMILLGTSCVISSTMATPRMMPHGKMLKTFNEQYSVNSRSRKTQELRSGDGGKRITIQNYSGLVYCVTTNAGAIVVKRNGKISICGNCDINLDNGTTYLNKSSSADKWKSSGVLEIAKKHNLFWGGNIAGYYDPIHFDMRNFYSIDFLRSKAIAQFGSAKNIQGSKVNLA